LNLAASLALPAEAIDSTRAAEAAAAFYHADDVPFATIGPIGIERSLYGAGACFLVMLLAYQLVGSGAGDVKLATAVGAVLGVERGLTVIVWCHLTAGAAILCWLVWRVGPVTFSKAFARHIGSALLPTFVVPPDPWEKQLLTRPVPLAAFFAIGTCLALWEGPLQ
jgi:hypothetical protein